MATMHQRLVSITAKWPARTADGDKQICAEQIGLCRRVHVERWPGGKRLCRLVLCEAEPGVQSVLKQACTGSTPNLQPSNAGPYRAVTNEASTRNHLYRPGLSLILTLSTSKRLHPDSLILTEHICSTKPDPMLNKS